MRIAKGVFALMMTGCAVLAQTSAPGADPLAGSRQVIVVLTDNHDTTSGTLQRFRRESGETWQAVGNPISVVVGRTGLAAPEAKREGDGKSPSGIFSLGTAFGFTPTTLLRMPYRQLRDTTECVDDSASRYYNQIVDRDAVPAVDWKSSEKMRDVQQYRWGMVVDYNTPAVPGRGSCIFLHVWSGPTSSTAGCTAMAATDLYSVLRWLDPAANPRLVQFTRDEYARMKTGPAFPPAP